MYQPDLAGTGAVKYVGYLWFGHSYPKGKIAGLIPERLVAIAEKSWFQTRGFHKCNLGFCGATQMLRDQPSLDTGEGPSLCALPKSWCRTMKYSIPHPI
jgi:hypothetical protein